MIWPHRRLKKVPLPLSYVKQDAHADKLDQMLRLRFFEMFPLEQGHISTRARISWGEYLAGLGICWEIKVKQKVDWDGWEVIDDHLARPRGLEDHVKVNHYYIPKDLALKILALGFLP